CYDPFHLSSGAVSFQPPGAPCARRQLAYRRAATDAERRTAARVNGTGGGTKSRSRDSEPASAGSGLHMGYSRWIHPDRVDGGRISDADAAPEARQDQLQGLEEYAMNCKAYSGTLVMASLALTTASSSYAADIRHLTLTEAIHLAISQNRA